MNKSRTSWPTFTAKLRAFNVDRTHLSETHFSLGKSNFSWYVRIHSVPNGPVAFLRNVVLFYFEPGTEEVSYFEGERVSLGKKCFCVVDTAIHSITVCMQIRLWFLYGKTGSFFLALLVHFLFLLLYTSYRLLLSLVCEVV